jgi:hypothetical protein
MSAMAASTSKRLERRGSGCRITPSALAEERYVLTELGHSALEAAG